MRLAALLLLLPACGDEARLVSGTYDATDAQVGDPGSVAVPVVTLDLDVEGATAAFSDDSGAVIVSADLMLWERADWPEGCPTNVAGTSMEVAGLSVDSLQLGDVAVPHPILVADCGGSQRVVLRDDGEFGGGGACVASLACVTFE